MNFKTYLIEKKKLKGSTADHYEQNLRLFKKWCDTQGLELKSVTYQDVMAWVEDQQKRKLQAETINTRLRAIRSFYDYKEITKNPARGIKVRGAIKKVTAELLSSEELEAIYMTYINRPRENNRGKPQQLTHQRNLVVLGFMVYQGLHSGEIQKLETSHIDLEEGKLKVPGTSRSNSRILPLKSVQILTLREYIENTRQELKRIRKTEESKLIGGRIYNITYYLMGELRKLTGGKVKSTSQIRTSFIVNLLKTKNIREVQYMMGYRYISSTEKYKQEDIEGLQEVVNRHHPLG